MGQQQLILLVLGVVLVGLAVVGGISAFNEGRRKAQVDALLYESRVAMTRAEVYFATPAALGGPDYAQVTEGDSPLQDFNFEQMGYSSDRIIPNTEYPKTCLRLSDGGTLHVGRGVEVVNGEQRARLEFLAMNPDIKTAYTSFLYISRTGPAESVPPRLRTWEPAFMAKNCTPA